MRVYVADDGDRGVFFFFHSAKSTNIEVLLTLRVKGVS